MAVNLDVLNLLGMMFRILRTHFEHLFIDNILDVFFFSVFLKPGRLNTAKARRRRDRKIGQVLGSSRLANEA